MPSVLGDGPMRFNEIKRMVGGISRRMLNVTLWGRERDGLVTHDFERNPTREDTVRVADPCRLWTSLRIGARSGAFRAMDRPTVLESPTSSRRH